MIASRLIASAVALAAASSSNAALAAMHLAGSVSSATSNSPLQALDYRSGSVSVGIDIFTEYLRVGLTHKQAMSDTDGWTVTNSGTPNDPSDDRVTQFRSTSHTISNSVDLTVILYAGDIFMPYLLAGVVTKVTYSKMQLQGGDPVEADPEQDLGPNVGAGLGIRLNRSFSLQLSYVASPGQKLLVPDENGVFPDKAKDTWDREASVGLKYQL